MTRLILSSLFLIAPVVVAQTQAPPAPPQGQAQGQAQGQTQARPATPRPAVPNPNATQPPDQPAIKLDPNGEPNKGFMDRHASFLERAKQGNIDVLFLGDSITQGWGGAGKEVWAKDIEPLKPANFGIGGDRTQHVLWRILNGEVENISPKVAVLMIGTNNSADNTPQQINDGVRKIVQRLREKLPQTKVLVLAIFPRGATPENAGRVKVGQTNELLAKIHDGQMVHYLDIGPKFLESDGTLSKEIMPDLLHLSPKGYQIWADAVVPKVKELMAQK